jgi:hypothetical protein
VYYSHDQAPQKFKSAKLVDELTITKDQNQGKFEIKEEPKVVNSYRIRTVQ